MNDISGPVCSNRTQICERVNYWMNARQAREDSPGKCFHECSETTLARQMMRCRRSYAFPKQQRATKRPLVISKYMYTPSSCNSLAVPVHTLSQSTSRRVPIRPGEIWLSQRRRTVGGRKGGWAEEMRAQQSAAKRTMNWKAKDNSKKKGKKKG